MFRDVLKFSIIAILFALAVALVLVFSGGPDVGSALFCERFNVYIDWCWEVN